MRIGVVETDAGRALAMPLGARWLNLSAAWRDYQRLVEQQEGVEAPADVGDLLRRGLFNRSFYRRMAEFTQRHGRLEKYALAEPLRFALPLRPGKVVAIGRNYRKHVEEFDNKMPSEPIYFVKTASACIGCEASVVVKPWYGRVDHEGEVGVVIGRSAREVAAADAQEYIAGYTLVNDVTARDMQKADIADGQPWFRSKNCDTFCPVGPVVAFRDALSWPLEEDIEVRVNGEVRQRSNTKRFIFDIPTLLEAITRLMTLEPGDIISTGTPEGVGPLTPGDVVEVASPRIGVLRNPVAG